MKSRLAAEQAAWSEAELKLMQQKDDAKISAAKSDRAVHQLIDAIVKDKRIFMGLDLGGYSWKSRIIMASGLFDREAYLQAYPDVAAAGVDPLRHYLRYGHHEGRARTK